MAPETVTARAVDSEVAVAVRRGVVRLNRRLRAERPPGSLPVMQLTVLGHLYREGASLPSEIATAEHHHPQSLTRVIAALTDEGLITRTPSPDDGRASVLDLTLAGRAAIREDMQLRDRWLEGAIGELSEVEAEVLRLAAGLLERLAAS